MDFCIDNGLEGCKKTEVGSIIGQHEMVVTWFGVLAPKVEIKMSGN